ncbi:MAG: helix-turn-helix transcriptional regulator [Oscillospiraceae bacterium]|nr:helix-turn-helix transcriptional regulator [Oscillospiraceae bacterium]
MHFAQNLWTLMQLHRLTAAQLAKELSLPEGTVQAWLENREEPTAAQLTAVRHFFSVTIDQLLDTPEPFVPGERYIIPMDGETILPYWKSCSWYYLKPDVIALATALAMALIMLIIRADLVFHIFNIVLGTLALYNTLRSRSTYKKGCRDLATMKPDIRRVYLFHGNTLYSEAWEEDRLIRKNELKIDDIELYPVKEKKAFVFAAETTFHILEHRLLPPNSAAVHFFDPKVRLNKKFPYALSSLVGALFLFSFNMSFIFSTLLEKTMTTSWVLTLLPLLLSFATAILALVFSCFKKRKTDRIMSIIFSIFLLLLVLSNLAGLFIY